MERKREKLSLSRQEVLVANRASGKKRIVQGEEGVEA